MSAIKKSALTIGVISLFFGWFGYTSSALACSCVSATPAQHFANATTVFVGKVKNISGDGWKRLVNFDVTDAQKGISDTVVTISTGSGGGDCGVDFTEGKEYTVYAYDDGGVLSTSICAGTELADNVIGNVGELLGVSSPEEPQVKAEEGSNLLVRIAGVVIPFSLGAAVAYLVMRRKTSK